MRSREGARGDGPCPVANRYADAGHYISYVKTKLRQRQTPRGALQVQPDESEVALGGCRRVDEQLVRQIMWAKFDDDQVSLVTEEDVRK